MSVSRWPGPRNAAAFAAGWLALASLLAAALLWTCPAAAAEPDAGAADVQQVLVLLQLPAPHLRADGYGGSYDDGAGRAARRRVAKELAREHGLELVTDWPMPLIRLDCYVMRVPASASPTVIAEALAADSRVAWAQPMNLYRGQGHNDPLYPVQPAAQAWHLSDLHAVATGRDVKVAVIDSGVDDQHPDLAGQVALRDNFFAQRPYVGEAHGTGVASVIAARADNGVGIAGVAPQARLLALRACWQSTPEASLCNTLSLARALHHAIDNEAQVINLSLAGPDDRLLAQLLDLALARGISVVGAADAQLPRGGFPASHPGVVAVVSQGSQPPPAGMLAAPGMDVPTAVPGGRFQMVSGSSFAAAHVAGLLALARQLQAQPKAVRASLATDAQGQVDACATLRAMTACACGCRAAKADAPAGARP